MAKKLFLLDSHALMYRAYYAMIKNPLTNSKGQPTGALYGFTLYLLNMIQEHLSDYCVAVFDSQKPSFRKQIFDQYKANRSKMPDDLALQIPLVFEIVNHLNLSHIVHDGFEADDIIASLAQRAKQEGFQVYIVSKDKDLMQLVSDQVHMLVPESGNDFKVMGPAQVKEKMGVGPESILDLLALMGDSSDNIPGVEGVGPKTAIKILQEATSVERLLKEPHCISNPKLRQKIIESIDSIKLSKQLATLRTDLVLDRDLEEFKTKKIHIQECTAFFMQMEFNSFLKHPLMIQPVLSTFQTKTITSIEMLNSIIAQITDAGFVSIDTETTSLEPHSAHLVGISLSVNESVGWYLPLGHEKGANLDLSLCLELLKPIVESMAIKKIGQNLKYDYQIFKQYDLTLAGIWFDTLIAAYLIDSGKRQYSLDVLATQWLNIQTIPIESLIGKGKNQQSFATVSIEDATRYSGEDAVIALQLQQIFLPLLQKQGCMPLFEAIEIPLVTVLAEMEWQGVSIDTDFLGTISHEYYQKLDALSKDIYSMAGADFNLNSPKQMSEILFEKLKLPKSRKIKTGLSTDAEALEKLAVHYPIAQKILEYREVQKLLSTYIDALPQKIHSTSRRVHTSFNQTVVATGRLSSTDPNLQNIPIRTDAGRKIREAFIAQPGNVILSADYSQIELRILAHVSQDARLIQAFIDGRDIHTETAAIIYGVNSQLVMPQMRAAAKTINFGLMYGMGPHNLSKQLGISFRQAQEFIATYFEQFPTIHSYMERSIASARTKGYCETILGRRRLLPDINSADQRVRESAERVAINTPVQGTAADIIKIAMISIYKELHSLFQNATMILQVHDELVFEVPQTLSLDCSQWIMNRMSSAYTLSVPLKVDVGIGANWSVAH